ncbi:hypothetical protein Halru_2825 [Halovivax ruber XH-70]|uniref:Uncharacterized protein n=1 Tax=Halovivax ruber (strain DSM 18193 / JCM 13892 / XH-70) TaxID=797302 RepID=L0IGQ7_HALRX|nr:hypothetical protein [Halovivax ruber]AGB17396.1 hypothetical protein Halru_2825 [Halovivax ruber XH-70]
MTIQPVDPRDPDADRLKAECDHDLELENYRLDDEGPWGCTVVATCVECLATVSADVEPESFVEL